MVKLVLKGA